MKRPWQVWLVFFACVIAAATGMVWLTRQALDSDDRRRVAEAEAELEQRVSLALWRMDTELAPIIAEEVIRPAASYRPSGASPVAPPQYVLLQFETRPNGGWVSPQSPGGKSKPLPILTELAAAVDLQRLVAELPSTPLPTAADVSRNVAAANLPSSTPPPPTQNDDAENLFAFVEGNSFGQSAQQQAEPQQPEPQLAPVKGSKLSRAGDFEQRSKRYQSAAQQSLLNAEQRAAPQNSAPNPPSQQPSSKPFGAPAAAEQVGVSRPVWIGDRLLLARRVTSGGETVVQGAWLDWPLLKLRLLGEATELLPNADLMPVSGEATDDPARMLAGLPVRLVVGESAVAGTPGPTLQWALRFGWGAVLLAVAAAAFLLHGVMTLSERRAAFVSSVTHELRTPLTTFRMYAEMLARGMVPDAGRRQEYFQTLQREAERLTLLVENVLAYARLERGRKPHAKDRTTLAALLDRIGPRLSHRAAQAGMSCDVQIDPDAAGQAFTTDTGVVEQILFNVVDNAAKYARDATDRRIHIEAGRDGKFVRLVVRDHGPGIEQRALSRRMRPFGKSAQESAESAPGVGLGLALCRRLARQLNGCLEIDTEPGGGTKITLQLPAD